MAHLQSRKILSFGHKIRVFQLVAQLSHTVELLSIHKRGTVKQLYCVYGRDVETQSEMGSANMEKMGSSARFKIRGT
jgi:hypothetical protein